MRHLMVVWRSYMVDENLWLRHGWLSCGWLSPTPRERQESEMRPQTDLIRVLADPNSSALADPAVASVVTKKSLERSSAGESSSGLSATGFVRPSRSSHKCLWCAWGLSRTFPDFMPTLHWMALFLELFWLTSLFIALFWALKIGTYLEWHFLKHFL